MKMQPKLLLIIMLLGSSILGQASQIPPPKPQSCLQVINSCDTAIQEQKKQIDIRDLRIKEEDSQVQTLSKEVTDMKSSEQAWYNSRFLWVSVGLVLGVYIERKI